MDAYFKLKMWADFAVFGLILLVVLFWVIVFTYCSFKDKWNKRGKKND